MVLASHVSLDITLETVNVLCVHLSALYVRVPLYALNVLVVSTWRELIVLIHALIIRYLMELYVTCVQPIVLFVMLIHLFVRYVLQAYIYIKENALQLVLLI